MSKEKNIQTKPGKSSGNRANATFVSIFVVDLIAVLAFLCSIYFDFNYANLEKYSIETLTFDSLLSILALISSFLIPQRDEKKLEKYHISESQYNFLTNEPKRSATYINLFIASVLLIIIDAFLFVYKLNWSLIAALIVELMYICVFVGPPIIEYVRGDNHIVHLAIRKFLDIFYYDNKAGRNITSDIFFVYPLQDPRKDEIDELRKIFGSVLANNDVKNIYDKIYKSLHIKNDKSSFDSTSRNLYYYFCNAINEYISDDMMSKDQYLNTTDQVSILMENIFYVENELVNLLDGPDDNPYYFCARSLYILGSTSSYYSDNITLDKFMYGIKDLLFDHYYFESPSSIHIKKPNLIVLNYILFQTIGNGEAWYVKHLRYYLTEIKMGNYHYNFYLAYVVFVVCFLISTKSKNRSYSERIKVLSNIIKDSYSEPFTMFFADLSPSEAIAFLHYLENSSLVFEENRDFDGYDIFKNNLKSPTTWADDFWYFLVLVKSISNLTFYVDLESYLSEKEKNKFYAFCNLCLEDEDYYKNISESILKYAFDGNIKANKNEIKKVIKYVLDGPNREQTEQEEISYSSIKKEIDATNIEIKKDSDYIDDDEISYSKHDTKTLKMQIVYCIDMSNNKSLHTLFSFLNSNFIIKQTFENFTQHFDDTKRGMNIINLNDNNVCKRVVDFKPKYYFVPNTLEYVCNDSVLKDIFTSLIRTNKYVEKTINPSIVFYKDDAVHFYIQVDKDTIKMRPLLDDEIGDLQYYFYSFREDFSGKKISLEDISKYVRVVTLTIDYDIQLNFDKILICDIPRKK